MPPSPALDSKYPQVPDNIKKALLQIIERSGTPVFEINLKDICDRNHELFGASGFDRRGLQFYFGNLRRKLTIQKWAHILDKAKVPHGEATTRLLRLEERQPSPETVASEEEATEEELSADAEAEPVDLRAQFENFSISSPPAAFKNSPHPARFSPLRSALKTPPRNCSPALPPSFRLQSAAADSAKLHSWVLSSTRVASASKQLSPRGKENLTSSKSPPSNVVKTTPVLGFTSSGTWLLMIATSGR